MERLLLRPYSGEADVPAIVEIMNAEWEQDSVPGRVSVPEKLAEYRHVSAMFDPRRDLTLAEIDGQPVGYAVRGWVDVADSEVRQYRVDGAVRPDWRRQGIGRAILVENMRRARLLATEHDTLRARVYGSISHEHQIADDALLRSQGFEPVRHFFDMARPNLDDVPDLPLPEGLVVRAVTGDDARAVWLADVESFRDHWGGFDDSEESFRRFIDGPEFDPRLWVVAFDGDEIAGGVINSIISDENDALGIQRGWLDSVFTRQPWRRRGLARALIARSLLRLRAHGLRSAVLNVDGDNRTGALGLYESVGFSVEHRSTNWRRPFQPGEAES